MIGPTDTLPVPDADDVSAEPEISDEFIPELNDVYELVDNAEDRLAARLDAQDAVLSELAVKVQWLGENVIPALTAVLESNKGIHGKFDAVLADVRAFVGMLQNSSNPILRRMLRKGGDNDAPEAEEEG